MNYKEASTAIEKDKESIYKIYRMPILEIMNSYNMSFEDATKLQTYAKVREEQIYWENMAAADKAHQERKSKKPTLFGSILNIVGFVIFVLCCFGGLIGVIIGLIISGIIYSIVENNYSTITQPSPHTLEIVDYTKDAKRHQDLYKSWSRK